MSLTNSYSISNGYNFINRSKEKKSSLTETLLAGVVGLFGLVGSGATYAGPREPQIVAIYNTLNSNKDILLKQSAIESETLTFNEQIKLIKSSLGLNMSAMAELLKVSRPTVYAWMKGESPKLEEHITHVMYIVKQARIYEGLNLDRPDNFIKRPIFNEESLFSLLKQGKTISESEYVLIKDLDSKESEARVMGLKKNEFRTSEDVLDDLT
ncbi:hypothetical protein [Acinetobacter guillouiae]|uniref:hypothetical protein n=1 Tax=Acinetobacter guillouiae TaxID=106649 RepID=UPI001AE1AA4A|nr:hypothetical protein [Acinetobacter guillouiae]MBP2546437.1 DNA-binding transcriptional regulator YiaG [Acinetobacter guillouiae]